jgi:hypothetical protein
MNLKRFKPTDFSAWFLRKEGERYIVLDKKKLDVKEETISYKDKTFVIPHTNSLEDKNKHIIFFDYDNEKVIAFTKIDLGYDAKMLDQLLVKKIIGQLVARIKQSLEQKPSLAKIGTYILCIAFGVVTGYVIGTSYGLG